jgi:tRNA (guanine37-N1)-methyltransferase
VTNLDGREFIREAVVDIWNNPFPPLGPVKSAKARAREQRSTRAKGIPNTDSGVIYPPKRRIDHFVMNLPGTAIEFLDAYRGILASLPDVDSVYDTMPMVHCHCFTREPEGDGARLDLKQVSSTYLLQHVYFTC